MPKRTAQSAIQPPTEPESSFVPESADDLLANMRLGERIRQLRLKRSMGLVELGRLTGLSASFLSQLETGRVVPTLRNLARLALVFGKDLSHFFDSDDHRIFRIQRRKDRMRLPAGPAPNPDYIAESFGILVPEGGLRPCAADFPADPDCKPFQPKCYPGVEMVYVIEGELTVDRKGTTHTLGTRDALYISGETPRTYRSSGSQPARAMVISFDSEPQPSRSPRRRKASNDS